MVDMGGGSKLYAPLPKSDTQREKNEGLPPDHKEGQPTRPNDTWCPLR